MTKDSGFLAECMLSTHCCRESEKRCDNITDELSVLCEIDYQKNKNNGGGKSFS